MPWIIGIDEAGYGPNLGPFVMTSVACRVPEAQVGANLWHLLAGAVRQPGDAADERLLIADSKQVYSSNTGLRSLETGVLASLAIAQDLTLSDLVTRLCPTTSVELASECWYTGKSKLPLEAGEKELTQSAERSRQTSQEKEVTWGLVRSLTVCPAHFNQMVDEWGSKGAVLGHCLAELLRTNLANEDGESAHFFVDKHGGRNTYAAMLQDAVPGSFVMAHEEGMERSVYSILGQGRELRVTFQPRADAEHYCVALASMVSKYLREVLMLEFNRFWQTLIPGLKPTAGYPSDAGRFFDAIQPAVEQLGLNKTSVWRKK